MNSTGTYTSGSPNVCNGEFHAYPKTYAGDPEYAAEYFSRCICGLKRKITTVTEVDAPGFGSEDVTPGEHQTKGELAQGGKE